MPATSSRMSSSSSTMRISDAIIDLFSFSLVFRLAFAQRRDGRGRQDDADHRPAAAMEIRRRIMKFQPAAMVLHDLLDDSETKPCALLARGHIGLEQPLAILPRQAFAIVDDVDSNRAIL